MNKRAFGIAGAVVALTMSLTACDDPFGSDTKASSPDPTSKDLKMTQVKGVIGMPEGFRNVALGCDAYGDMVFVTSRGSDFAGGPNGGGLGSGLFVVPNHKACVK